MAKTDEIPEAEYFTEDIGQAAFLFTTPLQDLTKFLRIETLPNSKNRYVFVFSDNDHKLNRIEADYYGGLCRTDPREFSERYKSIKAMVMSYRNKQGAGNNF